MYVRFGSFKNCDAVTSPINQRETLGKHPGKHRSVSTQDRQRVYHCRRARATSVLRTAVLLLHSPHNFQANDVNAATIRHSQELDGGVSGREGVVTRPPGEEETDDERDVDGVGGGDGGKENNPNSGVSAAVASPDGLDDLGAKESGNGKGKGKGAKKPAGLAEGGNVDLGKAKTGSRKGKQVRETGN